MVEVSDPLGVLVVPPLTRLGGSLGAACFGVSNDKAADMRPHTVYHVLEDKFRELLVMSTQDGLFSLLRTMSSKAPSNKQS
ncbi:hypothetical protein AMTR_s00120p00108050 [Amborella trichopoda]|uniref:Uncharacterized protein n=1 Tax=Amborella trichopoda TaxID=13333 RepID=W1NTV7_AMBTC|nr:hypothetical protein AMTR_s00120p00108050 [Amborella trichopoda]